MVKAVFGTMEPVEPVAIEHGSNGVEAARNMSSTHSTSQRSIEGHTVTASARLYAEPPSSTEIRSNR